MASFNFPEGHRLSLSSNSEDDTDVPPGKRMRNDTMSSTDGKSPRMRFDTMSSINESLQSQTSTEDDDDEEEDVRAGFGSGTAGFGSERASFGSETAGFGSDRASFGSETAGFGTKTASFGFERASFGSGTANDDSDSGTETAGFGAGMASDFLSTNSNATGSYSKFAGKMMAKMGFQKGKGLGKHGQGRTQIIEASKQRGRRGLGHAVKGFEPSDVEWKFEKEEVSAEETIDWIPSCEEPMPDLDTMRTWVKEGPKKLTIDDEADFIDEKILREVLKCKTVFDNLESEEMRRARTKSNPYETLRGGIFQNRAAMKMANMDAVLNFIFTNPKDEKGKPMVGAADLLYFGDVCAGPGGFSEYVLWRKKWESKGFGLTLKGPCDFKLEEFFAASPEMFEPYYGVKGVDGDGDIYKPENLKEFQRFVLENTEGKGLHFVMGDGGFSVEGQENIQEILSKRLYLCQCCAALSVLREGGHFVCKLFDIFTMFSAGIVYLMYRAFKEVSIFKPVTSRPANSERYIVCKGLRPGAQVIHEYMFEVNLQFEQVWASTSDMCIQEIVPIEVLTNDELFYNYIVMSNEQLGIKQAISLAKIRAFAQNPSLHENRQAEMREECLKIWQVPDEVRTARTKSDTGEKRFKELVKGQDANFTATPPPLSHETLQKVNSVYDYRCILCGGDRFYILGLGRSLIWKWDGRPNCKWTKADDITLELPTNTLLEAEIVTELRGEGKGQRKVNALHVIDAMVLCGESISDLHFNERHAKLKKFVKAITKNSRSDLAPIRVKEVFRFEEIGMIFQHLDMRRTKNSAGMLRLSYQSPDTDRYFLPRGLHIIKTVKDPWLMAFSNSKKMKYFYNFNTREAKFELPADSVASFSKCQENRFYWAWEDGVKVHDSQERMDPSKVSRDNMVNFVHSKTGRNR